MSKPVCKVEIWHDGALLHDVTDDIIFVEDETWITSQLGKFQVCLSEGSGNTFTKYNDISQYDDVYIWHDYDSISGNALFKGKIDGIYPYLARGSGYMRLLQGHDYGDPLLRRKYTKHWEGDTAHDIVAELATYLGFGTGSIGADATAMDIEAKEKRCFDILKEISDIRDKDFYVDTAKALHWFSRQSAGTCSTTLKENDNIDSYQLKRELPEVVFNDVTVKGARETDYPFDEIWSEADPATYWDETQNVTLTRQSTPTAKVGTYSIRASVTPRTLTTMTWRLNIPSPYVLLFAEPYSTLKFWYQYHGPCLASTFIIKLWCPDTSNHFETTLAWGASPDTWYHEELPVGPSAEAVNDGIWSVGAGSPTWDDVRYIRFYSEWTVTDVDKYVYIDALYWYPRRWENTQENGTSQTDYGHREFIEIDNDLHSNSECQDRATYLLAMLEEPIYHLDVTMPGDKTITVGKLINVDIPSRNIDTTFDVIGVKHHFDKQTGFVSNIIMSGRKQVRSPPSSYNLAKILAGLDEKARISLRGLVRK